MELCVGDKIFGSWWGEMSSSCCCCGITCTFVYLGFFQLQKIFVNLEDTRGKGKIKDTRNFTNNIMSVSLYLGSWVMMSSHRVFISLFYLLTIWLVGWSICWILVGSAHDSWERALNWIELFFQRETAELSWAGLLPRTSDIKTKKISPPVPHILPNNCRVIW